MLFFVVYGDQEDIRKQFSTGPFDSLGEALSTVQEDPRGGAFAIYEAGQKYDVNVEVQVSATKAVQT